MVLLRERAEINAVRFLLWDQDKRFYRYKLEVSPDPDGERWELVADRQISVYRELLQP